MGLTHDLHRGGDRGHGFRQPHQPRFPCPSAPLPLRDVHGVLNSWSTSKINMTRLAAQQTRWLPTQLHAPSPRVNARPLLSLMCHQWTLMSCLTSLPSSATCSSCDLRSLHLQCLL